MKAVAAAVTSADDAQWAKNRKCNGDTRCATLVDMRPRMEYMKAAAELVVAADETDSGDFAVEMTGIPIIRQEARNSVVVESTPAEGHYDGEIVAKIA